MRTFKYFEQDSDVCELDRKEYVKNREDLWTIIKKGETSSVTPSELGFIFEVQFYIDTIRTVESLRDFQDKPRSTGHVVVLSYSRGSEQVRLLGVRTR